MNSPHIPVLKNEVLDLFKDSKNGYILDCTLGYGGHSLAILESNPNIKIIANDQDEEALVFSKKFLENYQDRIIFQKSKFSDALKNHENKNIVGILADIGVSSLHLDKSERGFSFNSNSLDMRMDQESELDAKKVINEYEEEKLAILFREYGEIGEHKKLASVICNEREKKEITTPKELEDLVLLNFPNSSRKFLAVIFQALRIEVNDELGEISNLLEAIENHPLQNTIVAIISFHSLEDRIVKEKFKKWKQKCLCPKEAMKCECGGDNEKGKVLTKKPITASKEELKVNHRAKSSKMRVFKLLNEY